MKTKRLWATLVPVAAVLFLACLLAVPADAVLAAGKASRSGPLYTSADAVRTVQNILRDNGYLAAGSHTPGAMDRPTILALRQFQRRHYLRPTGLIDPETMGVLTSHERTSVASAAPIPQEPAAEESADWVEVTREEMEEEETVALSAKVSEAEEPGEPERAMPKTAGPVPIMLVLGGALVATGSALLLRRRG